MIEEPGYLSILRRSGSDRGAEVSAAAAYRACLAVSRSGA